MSKWLFIGHTRPQVVIQRPWAPALGPNPRWPFGIPRWLYRNLKRLNCCSKWLSRGPSGHLKGPSDYPETSSGLSEAICCHPEALSSYTETSSGLIEITSGHPEALSDYLDILSSHPEGPNGYLETCSGHLESKIARSDLSKTNCP